MIWAQKRQIIYFVAASAIAVLLIGVPLLLLLYHKPTCFDNKQNGDEQGVDCGGSCMRLCKASEIQPVVEWQQAFQVVPGVYNAVAYVQNPNTGAQSISAPYTFTFRDGAGATIAERSGHAFVPAGKNFAVFESSVEIPKVTGLVHTFFSFGNIDWQIAPAGAPQLFIKNQQVSGILTTPVVNADIQNLSFRDLGRVNATAIVYDTNGVAVAASKTYVDSLPRQSSTHIVFTWPQPFPSQVASCQEPSDVILAIDRSGSMASDGRNPAEPLTSVKEAALYFVGSLRDKDKVGLVSFATEATSPIDEFLTSDRNLIKSSIQNVYINKNGTQYTNIYDALQKSLDELQSNRHRPEAKQAIVLLTDGQPTYPEQKGQPTFAAASALSVARNAQSRGVEIYTIGLGQGIDEEFLKSVSGFTERYYRAPSSSELVNIYSEIGSALCKRGPAKVEIIPDILP